MGSEEVVRVYRDKVVRLFQKVTNSKESSLLKLYDLLPSWCKVGLSVELLRIVDEGKTVLRPIELECLAEQLNYIEKKMR